MISFGYQWSNVTHALIILHHKGKITLVIIYVDDMVMTGDDQEEMARFEKAYGSGIWY